MQPDSNLSVENRGSLIVYLILVALTILTWYLGKRDLGLPMVTIIVLATVFIKGHWIIADFMRLKKVSLIWRLVMHGWLLAVVSGIGLAYFIGV